MVVLLGLAACSSSESGTAEQPSASGSGVALPEQPPVAYDKWAWFKDTYWFVPPDGIYSVAHNSKEPSSFTVVRGQTVLHITDYFNGYWSGAVVVKVSAGQVPACQYVLGEVTPEGEVYMTMYDTKTGAVVNTPVAGWSRSRTNGPWST